jgi:DNA-binding MarR family transcriptional regulator
MKKLSDGVLFLGDFLPYRLSVLSNKISQAIADGYEEKFQLSLSEWRVMAILGGEPELSAGEVAERTAMDKVAVSRAVKKLLDTGRIARTFSPEDKRRSVLTLSESGEDIYQQIVPIALGYEQKVLENLSQDEQTQLYGLLDKLDGMQLKS